MNTRSVRERKVKSCAGANSHLQYLIFAAPEQEVYPEILQPFSLQAFLSACVSLPDGDLHCSHELPLPHKKQVFDAAVTSSSLIKTKAIMIAKMKNVSINSNFFIKSSPLFLIITLYRFIYHKKGVLSI